MMFVTWLFVGLVDHRKATYPSSTRVIYHRGKHKLQVRSDNFFKGVFQLILTNIDIPVIFFIIKEPHPDLPCFSRGSKCWFYKEAALLEVKQYILHSDLD